MYSEYLYMRYISHMTQCNNCSTVLLIDMPMGLCAEGTKVWQALRNFEENLNCHVGKQYTNISEENDIWR